MTTRYRNVNLTQLDKLASSLAKTLGKRGAIIGLVGALGSGKTTFVKHFAAALKIKKTKSPTFTIINTSKINHNFYHLDLYRLTNYSKLESLGFEEIVSNPHHLVLIEWADKFTELKKYLDLTITFEFGSRPNQRHVTIND